MTTSSVNFGNVTGGSATANGDVSVTCSENVAYHITLDAGLNYAAGARNLSDGGAGRFGYALYKDPALTSEWGDSDYANTFTGGSSLADTGNGALQAHTVYGRLLPGTGTPGLYTDTVTVTVVY